MKFLLSFAGVLTAILLFIRFVPSAPINPILPIPQGQEEVNGHNAEVPKGAGAEADHDHDHEAAGEEGGSTSIAPLKPGQTYGAAVTPADAVPMSGLGAVLGSRDSVQVKLVSKASAVCQAKGCWMTLPTADGNEMRVRFRDYAFFVPKDLNGHTVVVSGWAHRQLVSVADQQHYLRDAGKPEKEIAAITQPRQELNFMADGVLVQD